MRISGGCLCRRKELQTYMFLIIRHEVIHEIETKIICLKYSTFDACVLTFYAQNSCPPCVALILLQQWREYLKGYFKDDANHFKIKIAQK